MTYEQLLLLSPAQISEAFPHGAKEFKKRWVPAQEGEADKSLKRLLKDKRATVEVPRFLAAGPPYRNEKERQEKKTWTPEEEHGYTTTSYKAMDKLEVVDDATQQRFSGEASERRNIVYAEDSAINQARVIAYKLAKLQREAARYGIDIGPKLQRLVTETQTEIIAQRKEAA